MALGLVLTPQASFWPGADTLTVCAFARERKWAVHRRVKGGAKGPHNDKEDAPNGAVFLCGAAKERRGV
jgi:hypothetical protein